jgi:hypothetical protein
MSLDTVVVGSPAFTELGDDTTAVIQDLIDVVESDTEVVASEVAVVGWRQDGSFTVWHYFDDGEVVRLA